MSNIGISHDYFFNLQNPAVRILFCGYAENMPPSLWYHPNRISPFWRFYWGASEGAALNFADRRVPLTPQTVVLVPPELPFETKAEAAFSQLYIHFGWNIGSLFSEPLIFPATEERALLESSAIWHKSSRDLVAMCMYRILFCYLTEILKLEPERRKTVDPRILRAVRMLDDRKKDWHPAEIARELSMSYYHFMDLFRRQVGLPPGRYRMIRRMNYAHYLLAGNELAIKEIANLTGFASPFQFSKAFKQFFKLSPSACRKTMLRNFAASGSILTEYDSVKPGKHPGTP